MAQFDPYASLRERKLVVLGIPWDVETEELKYYMRKFGELEDCIVMKDRMTGKSRGFGYVTFQSLEDAKKAAAAHHVLNGRALDVKVATPKEEMTPASSRKGARIFVARIPSEVTEEMFRSYFQKYGVIVDAYMPKDAGSKNHRGIGFVAFENPESVDRIMNETHVLGGLTVAVDRATPKQEDAGRSWGRSFPDQYSLYSAYMAAAAAAAAAFGAGAINPMGGGFDFASLGFQRAGLENDSGENAWNSGEDGASKSTDTLAAGAAGLAYASTETPADGGSAGGYGASLAYMNAQNFIAAAANAASGFGSEAAQRISSAAHNSGAMPNAAYQNSGFEYVSPSPQTMGNSAAVYGSGASHSTAAAPASGYGSGTSYGGPSGASGYGAGVYYGNPSALTQATVPQSDAASMPSCAAGYGYSSTYANPPAGAPTSNTGYGTNAPSSGVAYDPSTGGATIDASSGAVSAAYDSGNPNMSVATAPNAYDSGMAFSGTAAGPMSAMSANRYGSGGQSVPSMGNKIFIGKLPLEATTDLLLSYFSSFGRISDVYIPKDAQKSGHRGFGFVTFADDGVAERVAAVESHEILGQPIVVDRPTPQYSGSSGPYGSSFSANSSTGSWGVHPGLQRTGYGGFLANPDCYAGGWSPYSGDPPTANRISRADARYKPY